MVTCPHCSRQFAVQAVAPDQDSARSDGPGVPPTPARSVSPRAAGYLKIAECAAELGVDPATIMALCRDGHLSFYLPPDTQLNDGRRGPKGLRISRVVWDEYLASRRFVGVPATPDSGPKTLPQHGGLPTGTDGIRRSGGGVRRLKWPPR